MKCNGVALAPLPIDILHPIQPHLPLNLIICLINFHWHFCLTTRTCEPPHKMLLAAATNRRTPLSFLFSLLKLGQTQAKRFLQRLGITSVHCSPYPRHIIDSNVSYISEPWTFCERCSAVSSLQSHNMHPTFAPGIFTFVQNPLSLNPPEQLHKNLPSA